MGARHCPRPFELIHLCGVPTVGDGPVLATDHPLRRAGAGGQTVLLVTAITAD